MIDAPAPPLRGVQEPRLRSVPAWESTSGDDALDLAAVAGLYLNPWQELVLRNAMGSRRDGKWAASSVALIAPRQNGKNSILEARLLAGLFLLGEREILHTAHEFKTAKKSFWRMWRLIKATPVLYGKCHPRPRTSNEEVSINLLDGGFIRFLARSRGAARGFDKVDLVVLDEAYALHDWHMDAMTPTQAIAENPQLWYTSSAGMGDSEVLERVRHRGVEGTGRRLMFMEWSCPPDVDIDDRSVWPRANPNLGFQLTQEFLEDQRDKLGDIGFAREHLGIWDDPRTTAVILPHEWEACVDEDSQVLDPIAIAVDVAPDQSSASIAVAGRRADGLPHVELVATDRGMSWVVDAAARLSVEWDALTVVVDGAGPAGGLVSGFAELGVEVLVTGARDMAQACAAFYAEVISGQLRHLGEPVLATAVAGSRKRPIGEAWGWARRDAVTDISPLVAVTLAWHGYGRTVSAAERTPARSGRAW